MSKFLSKIFSKTSSREYVIVISGGGARGAYALGVLQGLEKLGLDKQVKAVYGVSAGAMVGAYRCAGYSASDTYTKFAEFFSFGVDKIRFLPKKSLMKSKFVKKAFTADLPATFTSLKKPLYIGVTDANTAEYILLNTGPLVAPLMGTMAIPGVFEAVAFKNMLLVDGGTINNFPVELAKEKFPKAEIIGIALNKFKENQKIRNIFDSVSRGYDLLFSGQLVSSLDLVDHLFYRQLSVSTLDTKEKDMRKIFKQGFADCLEYFAK